MESNTSFGMVIEQGENLPKSLEIATKPLHSDFVDVTGFGSLSWVEIAQTTDDEKKVRLDGPFQLLQLQGRIRRAGNLTISDLVCTVSRQTDNGIQVLGGRLIRAKIQHLEVTVTPLVAPEEMVAFSPVRSESASTVKEAAPVQKKHVEPPQTAAPPRAESKKVDERWAKAVLESRRIEDEADIFGDESSDVRPKQGDIVNHRQFGECGVAMMSDDHITLRKPDGRNVQLGIKVLSFKLVGHRDGKDMFDVEVKPRF